MNEERQPRCNIVRIALRILMHGHQLHGGLLVGMEGMAWTTMRQQATTKHKALVITLTLARSVDSGVFCAMHAAAAVLQVNERGKVSSRPGPPSPKEMKKRAEAAKAEQQAQQQVQPMVAPASPAASAAQPVAASEQTTPAPASPSTRPVPSTTPQVRRWPKRACVRN
jgi:hypothetical protein